MGIRKVIRLQNVGRFRDCAAVGDVEFRRYTLVFAENGRGKSTLCAVLRSLRSGETGYVKGRRTLGSAQLPEIQILTNAGLKQFSNGKWNSTLPDLEIFDGTFVSENVYTGDAVDTEQRRNLYRFIIGEQNVSLARRVDELDSQMREISAGLRDTQSEIQRHVPRGVEFDIFLGLREDEDIDAKIQAKSKELETARAAEAISRRGTLAVLPIPHVPQEVGEILQKGLVEIATGVEEEVIKHIRYHDMQTRGEMWLSEGLGYIRDESCPFCGQEISGVQLINAYRTYFSNEYKAIKSEVAAMEREIDETLGEIVIARMETIIAQNEAAVEFWSRYCTFEKPEPVNIPRVREVLGGLRENMRSLIQRKKSAPLEPVAGGADLAEAQAQFENLIRELEAYNSAVEAANEVISARKQEAEKVDAARTAQELALLTSQKVRHTEEVRRICETYQGLAKRKKELDKEKRRVRDELDERTRQLMSEYEEAINEYLDRFNAGFRITGTQHTYRGGTPSSIYQIVINDVRVDLGNPDSPLDVPTFRNTLSAGDRSSLALAFFLAKVDRDPRLKHLTIVFDDPFSSQDSFRRNQTVFQIKRLGQRCDQVIVMAHDPRFLYALWEKLKPEERKALQLSRVGEDSTVIQEWDIEQAVEDRYRQDVRALQEFCAGEGDPQDVVRRIRPVLEAYCRTRLPALFGPEDTLGVIVAKIREKGPAHPLYGALEDLEELNEYTRRFHHGEGGTASVEPIDDGELLGYSKRTLRLVGQV